MSLFPETTSAPEPKWLADARRRTLATGEQTSITATDRRLLLKSYDELAGRLARLENEAAERERRHKQELAGAGQRAEYATATVRELLREFAEGCRMEGRKLLDERAEYRRLGRNEEKANLLSWAGMKARELGLPWPLPVEDYDGIAPAPARLAGEAEPPLCAECGDRVSWGHDFSNCATCRGIARGEEKAQPYAAGAPLEREDAAGQPEKGGQGE